MAGYVGRILTVDLTSGITETVEPDEGFFRRYLGGWNLIARTLLQDTPPGLDPLGPENPLIVAAGVASGLPLSGSARNAIGAKSPLTGCFGASEVGGFFPAELKRSGFDAVIVTGQANSPVYLWIHEGQAEMRDASEIWGRKTADSLAWIKADLSAPRARAMLIGPGAENLVRYACISNDLKHFAGRCGLGAVMGAKRLKAVVAHGSKTVPVANRQVIQELAVWLNENLELAGGLSLWGTGGAQEIYLKQGNLPVRNFRDRYFPE